MAATHRAGFVSNKNHYTSMVIVACVVGLLAYLAGVQRGDISCQLEASTVDNRNLNSVYNKDLEVNGSKPDFRNSKEWGDWINQTRPLFE